MLTAETPYSRMRSVSDMSTGGRPAICTGHRNVDSTLARSLEASFAGCTVDELARQDADAISGSNIRSLMGR
jgi:hypothetical protein